MLEAAKNMAEKAVNVPRKYTATTRNVMSRAEVFQLVGYAIVKSITPTRETVMPMAASCRSACEDGKRKKTPLMSVGIAIPPRTPESCRDCCQVSPRLSRRCVVPARTLIMKRKALAPRIVRPSVCRCARSRFSGAEA